MPSHLLSLLKRAALMVALFLFPLFCCQMVLAVTADKSDKSETYKDLIEKSYNLSLQQDRQQALSILVTASKRETKRGSPPKELLAAIKEVASIFYSDKTQQIHELALSLKQNDPAGALAKINEAMRLEPDNLTLLLENQRLLLATGDCSAALAQGNHILDLNPYSDLAKLHNAQALVCLGKFDLYGSLAASAGLDSKDFNKALTPFWIVADVERLYKKGEFDAALEKISQAEKRNSFYPEPAFWSWKIAGERKLKEEKDIAGTKYLTVCRKLTVRQFRDLAADPNLCRRTVEVENYLKKPHNP